MKYPFIISAALILALTSLSAVAEQGRGAGSGASADRAQQVDRDRTYDRDRMQDRARTELPDQDRIRDRNRDQDRVQLQDPSAMRDQDIYGNDLMSDAERNRYREKLGKLDTQQSREKYQARHEKKMQKRALKQGLDLVPPGQGPIYGGELMTVQERNEYREQLRLINSEQARQQFQAQHRDKIRKRAKALGLEVQGS